VHDGVVKDNDAAPRHRTLEDLPVKLVVAEMVEVDVAIGAHSRRAWKGG